MYTENGGTNLKELAISYVCQTFSLSSVKIGMCTVTE